MVNNQDKEIQRRIVAGWAAYAKLRDLFKSNLAIWLQDTHVHTSYMCASVYDVGPYMAQRHGHSLNKVAATQTKMERSTYNDRHLGQREDKSHRHNQISNVRNKAHTSDPLISTAEIHLPDTRRMPH